MNDRERLLATLAAVYAFYERELTELACEFWLEDLGQFPIEAVERAFAAHRRDPERGQWLPKPADIIRQLQGDTSQRAELAWAAALQCARDGGAGFARLPDPTRAAVEAIGGMLALRRADSSQVPHLQRQFLASHKAEQHREGVDALMLGVSSAPLGLLQ